jgi:hypothetical protein
MRSTLLIGFSGIHPSIDRLISLATRNESSSWMNANQSAGLSMSLTRESVVFARVVGITGPAYSNLCVDPKLQLFLKALLRKCSRLFQISVHHGIGGAKG